MTDKYIHAMELAIINTLTEMYPSEMQEHSDKIAKLILAIQQESGSMQYSAKEVIESLYKKYNIL